MTTHAFGTHYRCRCGHTYGVDRGEHGCIKCDARRPARLVTPKPMTRSKPLLPGTKPMRQFRKDRRPGNKPQTVAERIHVTAARDGYCVPCLVWACMGRMPMADVIVGVTYDHKKRGNLRIGHLAGFGSCTWHHQKYPRDGWTTARTREHYGPSLMDGSDTFRKTYGSNQALIALQFHLNEIPA